MSKIRCAKKNLQVTILEVFTLASSASFFTSKELSGLRMTGPLHQYQTLRVHRVLTMKMRLIIGSLSSIEGNCLV